MGKRQELIILLTFMVCSFDRNWVTSRSCFRALGKNWDHIGVNQTLNIIEQLSHETYSSSQNRPKHDAKMLYIRFMKNL